MTSDTSPRPVSPLRARMIEDMTVRGFNEHTRSGYVRHVRAFAAFIGRSSDLEPRLAIVDSPGFGWKSLILPLFWPDGKFHPRGAGDESGGSAGFRDRR